VKAVILVGGEGTRMRPLTYAMPKQMLPIAGTPMLERVMANLVRHGVTEAVLSLGYLPDRFLEAYPDGTIAGLPVKYAVEPERLDTAGAIRFAALAADIDDTFVVINGDVITNLDLTRLVAFHHDHQAQATIALHPVEDPSRFGVVPTDETGRVIAFVEKPNREDAPSNEINAGTYVLEPSVLNHIAPDVPVSVERVTFPQLADHGSLYALADDGYWLDTGTPQAYLDVHLDVLSGLLPIELTPAVSDGSWRHADAQVASSASLISATIDRDCVIGENVVIERSVLLPGAVIEDGAIIRDSVVGPNARVGAGAVLEETTVIGRGEVIAAGRQLVDERVGGPQ